MAFSKIPTRDIFASKQNYTKDFFNHQTSLFSTKSPFDFKVKSLHKRHLTINCFALKNDDDILCAEKLLPRL